MLHMVRQKTHHDGTKMHAHKKSAADVLTASRHIRLSNRVGVRQLTPSHVEESVQQEFSDCADHAVCLIHRPAVTGTSSTPRFRHVHLPTRQLMFRSMDANGEFPV